MTLTEIQAAVNAGRRVFWKHRGYEVIRDSIGQWLIKYHPNGHCIGLTWRDGTTMNGQPEDFFALPAVKWKAVEVFVANAPSEWHVVRADIREQWGQPSIAVCDTRANAELMARTPELARALTMLLDWGRVHLSPVHHPGVHELLVAAHEALNPS